jgi:hypothetical protein
LSFVEIALIFDEVPYRRGRDAERFADGCLKIVVVPLPYRSRIVQCLGDYLATGLGVFEELALAQHDAAVGGEPEVIDISG